MKTNKFMLILLVTFLVVTQADAKIIRVNGTVGADADYTTIQAAVDHGLTVDGDTLYIESAPTAYATFTATKRLVYIGPGYFLDENPETQANFTPVTISYAAFNSGSDGSVLAGLSFTSTVTINDDNIILKRNRLDRISINSTVVNTIIKNNYITDDISISNNCQNIMISNNYIDGGSASSTVISSLSTSALTVDHNVIRGKITAYNSVFSNNIIIEGTGWVIEQCTYFNNLTDKAQFGSANGNLTYIDMDNDVFVGATGNSTDGQWQLKTGSSAAGADTEGGDCGMFGGISPYILSGVPSLPANYYFYSTSEASKETGLRIRVKAKTHE
ncbi:MAG: hypothetical protein GXO90_02155 [FCB group bacterium]|nr:hypothetical protein [FCB group bacterium]